MPSVRSRLIRSLLVKLYMKPLFDLDRTSIVQMRQKTASMAKLVRLPKGTRVDAVQVANRPAEWVRAVNVSDNDTSAILYFHSGAFCLGYTRNHREFAARLSQASECPVLALDYRLAPEHVYPAANEDCVAAYQWLLEKNVSPNRIVIGGDSAGGGLALMTLLALRDAGQPRPAAAFLLSPLGGDLVHFDGESYSSRAKLDPLNTQRGLRQFAGIYFGTGNADRPVPLRQDLAGLPPLLIQVGDHEIILSDATRLAERATAAGVEAELEVWEGMWHVFQGFAAMIPEAREAIDHIGKFVRRQVSR